MVTNELWPETGFFRERKGGIERERERERERLDERKEEMGRENEMKMVDSREVGCVCIYSSRVKC